MLGIIYESWVLGFLPTRLDVFLKLKVPKPANLIDFDLDLDLIIDNNDSSMLEASLEEIKEFLIIFFTILFFVILIYLFRFLELIFHQFQETYLLYHYRLNLFEMK